MNIDFDKNCLFTRCIIFKFNRNILLTVYFHICTIYNLPVHCSGYQGCGLRFLVRSKYIRPELLARNVNTPYTFQSVARRGKGVKFKWFNRRIQKSLSNRAKWYLFPCINIFYPVHSILAILDDQVNNNTIWCIFNFKVNWVFYNVFFLHFTNWVSSE